MTMLHYLRDNFLNFMSGLGTAKDPTTATQYAYCELNRNDLEKAYRGNWIARAVVNAPAEDATREWRSWQASQDQIEKIEEIEKLHDLQKKMRRALIRARLYGGAALVMGVEDGGETNEELNLDAVTLGSLKWVVVMNRYELSAGPRIYDVESPWYTRPSYYTVSTPTTGIGGGGEYGTGMAQMHPSRVIEFTGNELPDWRLAPMGGGWGDSVIQTLDETLKDWGVTLGSIANMVNDAKMDVIKIPEFSKRIVEQKYLDNTLKRFSTANMMKSSVNTLIMDASEEWERVQTNFAGLPQLLQALMPIISAAGGIPVSRLMGQAPGKGLSQATSGGESDLYNYYDGVTAKQKTEYSPAMTPLDQVVIRSALGKYDPSVYYDWTPLYQPSPKEIADIALIKAQVAQADVTMGLINEDALRQARLNQLMEDGTYPGLDDAIDEHGLEPPVPTEEDMVNHLTMLGKTLPPHLGGPDPTKQIAGPTKDAGPDDEPRDDHGRWTEGGASGDYGLVAGDVDKFHALKNDWAAVNNHLLNYVDRPDSPEAKADVDQLEKISKNIQSLHADSGGPEGIGLPGGPRDVTVIGAGPGGLAASIFGGAEGLDTLVVDSNVVAGGQARYSSRIENFPGFPIGVTGETLTKNMFEQAKRLGSDQQLGVRVLSMVSNEQTGIKHLTLSNGKQIDSRTVILAGGVEFRRPTFPGADGPGVIIGDGKALAAHCVGQDATVIGGSNGAAQAALGAAVKATHVYLISRSEITKGMSDYQVAAVRNNSKITIIEKDNVAKVHRDSEGNISSVETTNGKTISSKAVGVFLGSVPETGWLTGVKHDQAGRIATNAQLETNIPGVFAIGDMREGAIGRIGVAVGEGQLALRQAHVYLEGLKPKKVTADSYTLDDFSNNDLISKLFDLDRANPYLGSTIENVKPGVKRGVKA